MKLAVSNIAWPAEMDSAMYPWLNSNGIAGIEVAPTRIWPEWRGITADSVREFRQTVESAGLTVCSLQSILFQKPELRLFGDDTGRQALYDHLLYCADLAGELGAGCLVFGAPKNRLRGTLDPASAAAIATGFFSRLGEEYASRGVCLGFEANPTDYGCDFATESSTAASLVRAASTAGFGLHLDTACLHLAGEPAAPMISGNLDILRHVHVSEPFLGGFAAPQSRHKESASTLAGAGYGRWVALEMRAADPPLPAIETAVAFLRRTYGNGN